MINMINKILLWFEKRNEHCKLRRYYPKRSRNKRKDKFVNIAIFTINTNHMRVMNQIIFNELYNYKNYNGCTIIRNSDYIKLITSKKEYTIKIHNINESFRGYNFDKVFVYEPAFYNDNLDTMVIPCTQRYCSKKDVVKMLK